MNKAREMVKWGMVCIAPNYIHNVARGRAPGDRMRVSKFRGLPAGLWELTDFSDDRVNFMSCRGTNYDEVTNGCIKHLRAK